MNLRLLVYCTFLRSCVHSPFSSLLSFLVQLSHPTSFHPFLYSHYSLLSLFYFLLSPFYRLPLRLFHPLKKIDSTERENVKLKSCITGLKKKTEYLCKKSLGAYIQASNHRTQSVFTEEFVGIGHILRL